MTRPRHVVCLLLSAVLVAHAQHPSDRFRHLLGFTLNQDSLASVQRRLGASKLIETGDAAEYEASVSYIFKNLGTVVSFKSGEMGGGTQLLQYELRRAASFDSSSCAVATIYVSSPEQLNVGGLTLGMTPEEFKKQIGRTLVWDKDTARATIEFRHTYSAAEYAAVAKKWSPDKPPRWYNVYLEIQGVFEARRLCALKVSRSETLD
jgi:hypothetical protein